MPLTSYDTKRSSHLNNHKNFQKIKIVTRNYHQFKSVKFITEFELISPQTQNNINIQVELQFKISRNSNSQITKRRNLGQKIPQLMFL